MPVTIGERYKYSSCDDIRQNYDPARGEIIRIATLHLSELELLSNTQTTLRSARIIAPMLEHREITGKGKKKLTEILSIMDGN